MASGCLLRQRPVVPAKILQKDRRWEARFINLRNLVLKKAVV